VEERLRCRAAEAEAAKGAAETAGERLGEAEARERDLYEENKRLAEHISVGWGDLLWWVGGWVLGNACSCNDSSPAPPCPATIHPHIGTACRVISPPSLRCCPQDLESRKRAPLYQKKQEEELKAATDKAAEAEVRAGEAELRCKEAKVRRRAGRVAGWVGG
jgi:hypothetical protein